MLCGEDSVLISLAEGAGLRGKGGSAFRSMRCFLLDTESGEVLAVPGSSHAFSQRQGTSDARRAEVLSRSGRIEQIEKPGRQPRPFGSMLQANHRMECAEMSIGVKVSRAAKSPATSSTNLSADPYSLKARSLSRNTKNAVRVPVDNSMALLYSRDKDCTANFQCGECGSYR